MLDGDGVGSAVSLHHVGMLDREIRSALFEIIYRVAFVLHDPCDEFVGIPYRLAGNVDETLLDAVPLVSVPLAGFIR